MSRLHRLRDFLVSLETWLAGFSLLALVISSFIQILVRNTLDTGIPGLEEAARHLVLYVMFFGAVLAIENAHHIKIDLLSAWQSRHPSRWLPKLLHLVGATVCGLLANAALRFWQDEWEFSNPDQQIEVLLNLVLPVGFGLLTVHFLFAFLIGPQTHNRTDT